jgi:hypothetical protein
LTPNIPEFINLADYCLDAHVREGRGSRRALITDEGVFTYAEVQARANRFAGVLRAAGVEPEQRVLIALGDGLDWVATFFATLKLGAAVVMANPGLKKDEIEYFLEYTRAKVVVTEGDSAASSARPARGFDPARGSGRGGRVVREAARGHGGSLRELQHPSRRRRDLALLRWNHGSAEGSGADPPLFREHHGAVRQGVDGLRRRTTSPCRSRSSSSATPPART